MPVLQNSCFRQKIVIIDNEILKVNPVHAEFLKFLHFLALFIIILRDIKI